MPSQLPNPGPTQPAKFPLEECVILMLNTIHFARVAQHTREGSLFRHTLTNHHSNMPRAMLTFARTTTF